MEYQPESNRLLYSQLLADCIRTRLGSSRGISYVSKTARGQRHWYLQLVVGRAKTQHYLGPDSDELRAAIEKEKQAATMAAHELATREKLVAMLLAGGAATVSAGEARVLELLERAGVFLVGGTLIGSHAFAAYANMLGVHWQTETTRTKDVDIAAGNMPVAIDDSGIDLRKALMESGMGFFEVPALNRKHPSTSYAIRGKELSVDLLTPLRGRPSTRPVLIKSLGAPALPMRFLDYLLEDTQPAIIVARAGVLVNVPAPARYTLHKLVVRERRPAAWQTKSLKDATQAEQLIEVLAEDRPGDLADAWKSAKKQPAKFQQQLQTGIRRLPSTLRQKLHDAIGLPPPGD